MTVCTKFYRNNLFHHQVKRLKVNTTVLTSKMIVNQFAQDNIIKIEFIRCYVA